MIALASANLEGHARASAPVLLLDHLLIPLHLRRYLDSEMLQHVAGDEHVGDALGVGDYEGGGLVEERQRGQQAGDELRAVLAGDLGYAGDDAAFHVHGDGILAHYHSERGHDVAHAFQRAVGEGFFAGDGDGAVVDGGHQGDHQARQQPGFAGVQGFEIRVCSADAVDGDGAAVDADFRAERAGGFKGCFAVGAGGVSAEMAPAFGEGGGDDCALRETLGCGHLQGVAEESAPTAVDLPVHCEVVDLPGGGGFFVGEGCVAEWGASLQAFDAGCAAFRAHCKGDEAIRDGQRAGPCPTRGARPRHCPSVRLTRTIQRHDAGGVISGMGGDDDFSDVGAVAIATIAHLLQVLQVRSAAEVVE